MKVKIKQFCQCKISHIFNVCIQTSINIASAARGNAACVLDGGIKVSVREAPFLKEKICIQIQIFSLSFIS